MADWKRVASTSPPRSITIGHPPREVFRHVQQRIAAPVEPAVPSGGRNRVAGRVDSGRVTAPLQQEHTPHPGRSGRRMHRKPRVNRRRRAWARALSQPTVAGSPSPGMTLPRQRLDQGRSRARIATLADPTSASARDNVEKSRESCVRPDVPESWRVTLPSASSAVDSPLSVRSLRRLPRRGNPPGSAGLDGRYAVSRPWAMYAERRVRPSARPRTQGVARQAGATGRLIRTPPPASLSG